MKPAARHHLTIQEKNRLRVCRREHPELTQEQLREWAHAQFGKWVGRSTVGKIASMPEETCANPTAKRHQTGRFPEMEKALYAFVLATAAASAAQGDAKAANSELPMLSEAMLWSKANEILQVTNPGKSVSVGWVQRFKKRHGLHRSQRNIQSLSSEMVVSAVDSPGAAASTPVPAVVAAQSTPEPVPAVPVVASVPVAESATQSSANAATMESTAMPLAPPQRAKRPRIEEKSQDSVQAETAPTPVLAPAPAPARKKQASAAGDRRGGSRKQFVSSDDIVLLTQVLEIKPWTFPHAMDGWHEVAAKLRALSEFRLEKTPGACQARLQLLLDHLRAGNVVALRKTGTADEYTRKRALLLETQSKLDAYREKVEDRRARSSVSTPVVAPGDTPAAAVVPVVAESTTMPQHDVAVASMGEAAMRTAIEEAKVEVVATGASSVDDRRLELLERRMERELAAQRRHADEQVKALEKLQRAQLESQQSQHAQLLATIQQQQAMMLDLIKSVAPVQASRSAPPASETQERSI